MKEHIRKIRYYKHSLMKIATGDTKGKPILSFYMIQKKAVYKVQLFMVKILR